MAGRKPPSISVETLVEHLIAAKRALSSMAAVLQAREIVTTARAEHEDAAILAAQAGFVRYAVVGQVALLMRLRRSLQVTYDSRRRRFDKLTRTMDAAHQKLQGAMDELRRTTVRETIPSDRNQPAKTLLDFVDQDAVKNLENSMRKSLRDLQVGATAAVCLLPSMLSQPLHMLKMRMAGIDCSEIFRWRPAEARQ